MLRKEDTESLIVPVILCGGSGTRLWPASREKNPKQFLSLLSDFSLLQETMIRALRISGAPAQNLVTVTLGALSEGVAQQLAALQPAAARHILTEPVGRDTAAAVAFAAHYVKQNFGPEAIMWVLPADHHIGDENAMTQAFAQGVAAARAGYLVTFGIHPTRPETGYGYIRLGQNIEQEGVFAAQQFVEKPNLETAKSYLAQGDYLWNSGMFVFSAEKVLENFRLHALEVDTAVIAAMNASANACGVKPELYAAIEKRPFDKAIMEKSKLVAVVPCNPAWSDIGAWESIWEIRPKDTHGNVTEGQVACFESKNCLVQAKDRLIACAGVENLVVIETEDAILIADRSNGDVMKTLVNGLKKQGRREVEEMVAPAAPVPDYGLREISTFTGEVQSFTGRAECCHFITVIEGKALVSSSEGQRYVSAGENIFLDAGDVYKIQNVSASALKLIEVSKPGASNPASAAQPLRQIA